jgi:histidinol dehydrogenase
MKTYKNPSRDLWAEILARPAINQDEIRTLVRTILDAVKSDGDSALRDLTMRFDGVDLKDFSVSNEEIENAGKNLSVELKRAIDIARENIGAFHAMQRPEDKGIATAKGVKCWIKNLPVEKVGLYIPGGTAPLLSTVLMLGIPARLAGCSEIILCTPPGTGGIIHPAILYCASLVGIDKIFKVGGAQSIAAMAYGTESIPAVEKIFGPGNSYVTVAKQLVSVENVAIDMPAGPSELAVMADAKANPAFIASDLLSQAEHGTDSQVVLFTTSMEMADKVKLELKKQISTLPRRDIAGKALENSRCIILDDIEIMIDMVNSYAPEHLIIIMDDYREIAGSIRNAGSVFLGPFTPESAGDYASGTNHTLPTGGCARAYSGLGLESFMKKISFQEIDETGLKTIGPAIMEMAAEEELEAHRKAVLIRLNKG